MQEGEKDPCVRELKDGNAPPEQEYLDLSWQVPEPTPGTLQEARRPRLKSKV